MIPLIIISALAAMSLMGWMTTSRMALRVGAGILMLAWFFLEGWMSLELARTYQTCGTLLWCLNIGWFEGACWLLIDAWFDRWNSGMRAFED